MEFDNQFELTSTLLRFQGHYESPKYIGQIFTLKEFKKWYSVEYGNGEFSYYKDWSGFNFPSYILEPFFDGKFSPLSTKEKKVLKLLQEAYQPYYVIGTYKDKLSDLVILHETAHAMFYCVPTYKKEVMAVLKKIDCKDVEKVLKGYGYHKTVFKDETHAWLMTNASTLSDNGADMRKYTKAIAKLKKIYEKYKDL